MLGLGILSSIMPTEAEKKCQKAVSAHVIIAM